LKILYPIIDGEITGGNMICLRIIEESIKRGYAVIVNSPTEGKFTHILREKGLKVYNIDTRRTFRFDSAIKLAGIIKKEGINLVHSHTPLAGVILSRVGGWMAAVPVITHAHLRDTPSPNPFVKWYQFLLNWVTSRFFCAKVIAVSETVKREFIEQGTPANKITVVYNGIDLDDSRYNRSYIKIREEFGLKQNQRIIGEVSRLCKTKGQHILIEAAPKVLKEFPEAVFAIVGEDFERAREYENSLKRLASDLGVERQIIFTGYRSDITELMHAFDLFILPSSMEGLPVVILEAMAAKKPVITTLVGGNAEIVMDGKTGTIIPPEDPERLAETIIYHLKNPEISNRMGEKGYERVKRYFSLSQMVNGIMEIYKDVVGEKQWQL
jgi:glycosyltransferase involved in cell wall biosynthesis